MVEYIIVYITIVYLARNMHSIGKILQHQELMAIYTCIIPSFGRRHPWKTTLFERQHFTCTDAFAIHKRKTHTSFVRPKSVQFLQFLRQCRTHAIHSYRCGSIVLVRTTAGNMKILFPNCVGVECR